MIKRGGELGEGVAVSESGFDAEQSRSEWRSFDSHTIWRAAGARRIAPASAYKASFGFKSVPDAGVADEVDVVAADYSSKEPQSALAYRIPESQTQERIDLLVIKLEVIVRQNADRQEVHPKLGPKSS